MKWRTAFLVSAGAVGTAVCFMAKNHPAPVEEPPIVASIPDTSADDAAWAAKKQQWQTEHEMKRLAILECLDAGKVWLTDHCVAATVRAKPKASPKEEVDFKKLSAEIDAEVAAKMAKRHAFSVHTARYAPGKDIYVLHE